MRRPLRIAAAAAAAFVLVVIVEFPARWAAAALPRGASCAQLSGTLWRGACAGLTERGAPLGDLTWSIHPLRLLTGALSADISLTRAAGDARARIDLGFTGRVAARDVHAVFPLDHSLLPAVPPSTHGSVQADLSSVRWDGRRITAVSGRIDVRGLTGERGEPLGDYRLAFPRSLSGAAPGKASADPVGRLRDLGGPFAVDGTVRLTGEPGYVIDAQVAPRPGAPPDIVNALRFLGTPDAGGRRPFSLAGTF